MSFKSIKFTFTPPPTLIPNSESVPVVSVPVGSSPNNAVASSNAGQLLNRLTALSNTSQYLQDVISSLIPNLGITFDLNSNTDLSIALSRIYNTTAIPSSMDLVMYKNLLQADVNCIRFDLANSIDSPIQISPVQRADFSLLTKHFESTLIGSGVYDQTFPVLLRSLMGDQVIFDSLSQSINKYPILAVSQLTPIQIASNQGTDLVPRALNSSATDMSPELTDSMNTLVDKWGQSYAGVYNLLATPDPIETALPSIVSAVQSQPLPDLVRILSLFQNLTAFIHKPQLQQTHDSADNFLLPRLFSDMTSHSFNLDFVNQIAVNGLQGLGSGLGSILTAVSQINIGSILTPGLTGLVQKLVNGPSSNPLVTDALSALPVGLKMFSANLKWAQTESARQSTFNNQSVQRLGLRRLNNQGDQTELLSSLKSLSSSISVIQSFISTSSKSAGSVGQVSSLSTTTADSTQGLQSFGTLIGSLNSQSGSSYSVDGNTLIIAPPQIPSAPADVQSILSAGGVNQFTTETFQSPINFGV